MKKIIFACSFVLFAVAFTSRMVVAQESEDESRYLISIANEIENVKSLAKKAQANADIRARTRFDYEALQRDLEQMQKAIERHAQEPSRTPRAVPALSENYTRKVNDE